MIRVIGGKLRWGKEDIHTMVKVIGAEEAVKRRAPFNPAMLKVAQKKGVALSKKSSSLLDKAEKDRIVAWSLKGQDDVPVKKLAMVRATRAFPHQRVALDFFQRMGSPAYLVTDDTGVGKTLQALLFALYVANSTRTLIITKNILKDQWADAIREFLGQKSITVVDGTIALQNELAMSETWWVIGHWQSLNHALYGYMKNPWGCILLDEAHYIGNPKTYRSKAAYKLRAPFRMAMTASPFSKDPAELNGVLRFLFPQTYGSYWRFFNMHVKATPEPFGGHTIEGVRRPQLLKWELAPFTLQRTKQEVFKSLPRISRPPAIVGTLSVRGVKEYDRLRKAVFAELAALEGGNKYVPIINDLVRVMRLRQYLIDPGIIGAKEPSVKYPLLVELLDKIQAPTVVFTQFKKAAAGAGAFIQKHTKLRVRYIWGGMRKADVPLVKKEFIRGEIDVLLVVAESGDTGLNLGGYGYVVALDLPWTIRGLKQYEGRVDRPQEGTGKLVPTTSYRIVVANSYETKMEKRLVKQDNSARQVFTVADLKELFA
jgi:SNF2 family DNA or RNA helicase